MVEIRPATAEDAAGIARVQTEVWRDAYEGLLPADFLARREITADIWLTRIRQPPAQFAVQVAVDDTGTVVGFAALARRLNRHPLRTSQRDSCMRSMCSRRPYTTMREPDEPGSRSLETASTKEGVRWRNGLPVPSFSLPRVVVYIPEYVVGHWWELLLYNQSALLLKARLLFQHGVMVTNVPWHVKSSDNKEQADAAELQAASTGRRITET